MAERGERLPPVRFSVTLIHKYVERCHTWILQDVFYNILRRLKCFGKHHNKFNLFSITEGHGGNQRRTSTNHAAWWPGIQRDVDIYTFPTIISGCCNLDNVCEKHGEAYEEPGQALLHDNERQRGTDGPFFFFLTAKADFRKQAIIEQIVRLF